MNPKIRVLMIDDDQALTRAIKLNLEDGGRHEVTVLNRSRDAIESARSNPPDVVLLDVMMPAPDGVAVANSMLDTPELAQIPVIFLTALVGKSEEKALREHKPARRYLGKPVTARELERAIDDVLCTAPG